jgi:MFS family permease
MNERSFLFYAITSIYVNGWICNIAPIPWKNASGKMVNMSSLEQSVRKHLRFNRTVNLMDGAFFGLGWGFGSIGTIIPLFVSHMTSSALLIGLIPAIHAVGWQLPQLFMANSVSRLRRYKPMVMLMTIHERLPYLGLALVALFLGMLGTKVALVLTFAMLIWQGLGAGFTANAWQSMVAKIIPSDWRGTFFGAQAALANILMSLSAVAAGFILDRLHNPVNFTLCFVLTLAGLGLSYITLGLTREPTDHEKSIPERQPSPWKGGLAILRQDKNFTAYLVIRLLSQFATMGFAFYIVYGLRRQRGHGLAG